MLQPVWQQPPNEDDPASCGITNCDSNAAFAMQRGTSKTSLLNSRSLVMPRKRPQRLAAANSAARPTIEEMAVLSLAPLLGSAPLLRVAAEGPEEDAVDDEFEDEDDPDEPPDVLEAEAVPLAEAVTVAVALPEVVPFESVPVVESSVPHCPQQIDTISTSFWPPILAD